MGSPKAPITLGPEQVEELLHRLADMRHNINNYLSLMTAAAEIVIRRPETAQRLLGTLIEQPAKITQELRQFSTNFEEVIGITKDG